MDRLHPARLRFHLRVVLVVGFYGSIVSGSPWWICVLVGATILLPVSSDVPSWAHGYGYEAFPMPDIDREAPWTRSST